MIIRKLVFSKLIFEIILSSGSKIDLTLWGNEAEVFTATENPVLMVRKARVIEFNGPCLTSSTSTTLQLNPECQEAAILRVWYETCFGLEDLSDFNLPN